MGATSLKQEESKPLILPALVEACWNFLDDKPDSRVQLIQVLNRYAQEYYWNHNPPAMAGDDG